LQLTDHGQYIPNTRVTQLLHLPECITTPIDVQTNIGGDLCGQRTCSENCLANETCVTNSN